MSKNTYTELCTTVFGVSDPSPEAVPLLDSSDDVSPSEIITINVSGRRFQTRAATLRRLPLSLLGDEERRAAYRDPQSGELFFDRSADSFAAVLHVYQSGGQVRRPPHVPPHVFLDDVRFYQLGDAAEKLALADVGVPLLMTLSPWCSLPLFLFFWVIALLVFSGLIHYMERGDRGMLYPLRLWFALAAMLTTPGYGMDVYPKTAWGSLVGGICACAGYLIIITLVVMLVDRLLKYFIPGKYPYRGTSDSTSNIPVSVDEEEDDLVGFPSGT